MLLILVTILELIGLYSAKITIDCGITLHKVRFYGWLLNSGNLSVICDIILDYSLRGFV